MTIFVQYHPFHPKRSAPANWRNPTCAYKATQKCVSNMQPRCYLRLLQDWCSREVGQSSWSALSMDKWFDIMNTCPNIVYIKTCSRNMCTRLCAILVHILREHLKKCSAHSIALMSDWLSSKIIFIPEIRNCKSSVAGTTQTV